MAFKINFLGNEKETLLKFNKLLIGTFLIQIISLVAMPFLAKIYSVEVFAVFQLYVSLLSIVLTFSTLRYELVILLVREKYIISLLQLCFLISIIATLIFSIIIFLVSYYWKINPEINKIDFFIYFLIPSFFISSSLQYLTYLNVRNNSINSLMQIKAIQIISYLFFSIAIGCFFINWRYSLIFSDLLGKILALCFFLWCMLSRNIRIFNFKMILSLAKKYKKFPIIGIPSSIVNSLGGYLTPLLLYSTFPFIVSGQYALIERVILSPVGLISQSASQIFSARLTKGIREKDKNISKDFNNLFLYSCVFSAVISLCIFYFGPAIFNIFFDKKWILASSIIKIISPLVFITLITFPINMALDLVGQQKKQFSWEIFRLSVHLLGFLYIRYFSLNFIHAISVYVICSIIASLVFILLAKNELHKICRNFK